MTLIDYIPAGAVDAQRSVALYRGNLAAIPDHEAVDLLVVSAFPDDYAPTAMSLIGALHRRGVSVASLAAKKAVDLRHFSSCWLSDVILQPGINFKRVLCFEPRMRGKATEVVGDVFRSLVPFCTGTPPITQIAMPILAAGDQRESPSAMLEALLDAALHWLEIGLPLERIKIVIRTDADYTPLEDVFKRVKARRRSSHLSAATAAHRFDAFLSYSRKDQDAADYLHAALTAARPTLRLFIDRLELQTGAAWQQHIFEALDNCRKVIPLLSPSYAESKVCKEEFNIALFRHRDSPSGVLLPIFLRTADLPTYMRMVQSLDARENDHEKLSAHVGDILNCLS